LLLAVLDSTARVWSIAQALKEVSFDEALALVMIPKLIVDQDKAPWISLLHRLSLPELYSLAAYYA
jgi:hypothetical protein